MPRRKLLVPAVPTVTPEQGSLQETVALGDAASVHANPATKLRWFATRAEIQMRIQNDEIGKAKAEVSQATAALSDAQAQLQTATDEIARLTAKVDSIESAHKSQLESANRRIDEATARAAELQKQLETLKPAINELDAQKKEAAAKKQREEQAQKIAARRAVWQARFDELTPLIERMDLERDTPKPPNWNPSQSLYEREQQEIKRKAESALRNEYIELKYNLSHSFEEIEQRIRKAKAQADREKAAQTETSNVPKLGDQEKLNWGDLQEPRYVRDRVADAPVQRHRGGVQLYGFEKIPPGYTANSYDV